MNVEEIEKNTPLEKRPLINDTPGKPAHPMTDEQYAEYLKMQAEVPESMPTEEEKMQSQIDDLWLAMAEIEFGGM